MKVLHVTPTFAPSIGGIETVVVGLTSHLSRYGIAADVLHVSCSNNRLRRDSANGCTVWRVPLFPHRLVGVIPPIRSLLMSYDLLHVHDPQGMALSANILVQGRGRKKLLSTHGGYFHTTRYSPIKKLHWNLFAGAMLKHYDEVLASSIADYQTFKSRAPHVKLVANGVDTSRFATVTRSPTPPLTDWLFCGRLSRNKRIDLLIDTVKRSRDAGLNINLTIIGQDFDGLLPAIHAQVGRYELRDHVRVLGPLSELDLLAEFASHTVFITASEYEGFGLSVIEAMSAGLVVICRNISPLNSFVTHGKNGILIAFDGGSDDFLSLKALCSASSAQLSDMQDLARTAARAHSWETVIKQYIEVYENVLRQ
jgi:alpha-1,3-mannosyltransferase